MRTKKISKGLLLSLMLMISASAFAHDFKVDGIYYNKNSDGVSVSVTYRGNTQYSYDDEYSGTVVIPESVTYNGTTYSVTSIGDYAFCNCAGLTSVEIPNSVTSIDDYAFSGCSGLTDVKIADRETELALGSSYGSSLFADCPLKTVYIGGNISYPSRYSPFYGKTSLKSVVIGNSVTSIGNSAFSGCSGLKFVVIGNSVTSIGYDAFYNCAGLTSVEIPNSVTSIGNEAFRGCI